MNELTRDKILEKLKNDEDYYGDFGKFYIRDLQW